MALLYIFIIYHNIISSIYLFSIYFQYAFSCYYFSEYKFPLKFAVKRCMRNNFDFNLNNNEIKKYNSSVLYLYV